MTVPIAARDVAAAAGAHVLSTVVSVVGTVMCPRRSGSRLTRLVASGVNGIFGLIVRPVAGYRWRDRILAARRRSSCSASWRSGCGPSMSATRC